MYGLASCRRIPLLACHLHRHLLPTYVTAFCLQTQTGQVMLTKPNALAKAGVGTGLIVVVITGITGFWTMILMMSMYFDRKRDLVSGWQCECCFCTGS